jgi:hypothetical protein
MIAFLLNPGGRRRRRRRRNAWRGHKRAHRLAALRGWHKRRRGGRARRRGGRARRRGSRRRCRTAKYVIAGKVRTRCRRRRHKATGGRWNYDTLPTSTGGWSYPGGQVAANRRRRRRHRNTTWVPQYAMNPSWVPQYAMNPGKLSFSSLKRGFSPSLWTRYVLPASAGFAGNYALLRYVGGFSFVPSFLSSGVGNLVLGLVTAGLLGGAASFVGFGTPVFLGSVLGIGVRALDTYVWPKLAGVIPGLSGLADYLTVGDAAAARPLGCYGCGSGLGLINANAEAASLELGSETPESLMSQNPFTLGPDYTQAVTPEDYMPQLEYAQQTLHGMGDYLTVGDAANARPLGRFGDYLTVGDAAAARPLGALGRTMNDAVIEGTATSELGQ